ncbi:hypothetical protein [Spirulina subsalsa]|uniref:hypothetical protein n=1 Tax=Spirulina subsalsa TaxID=54311 RepID=UPI0003664465|nr:hypothetical protein [Spirulina subsalsa]
MARYSCSFNMPGPLDHLVPMLGEVLRSCNFEIIYDTGDYMMGREIPGRVSFSKLVTVEALIDRSRATNQGVNMNFVIKNEELPLQAQNHCREMFDQVKEAIESQTQGKLRKTPDPTRQV